MKNLARMVTRLVFSYLAGIVAFYLSALVLEGDLSSCSYVSIAGFMVPTSAAILGASCAYGILDSLVKAHVLIKIELAGLAGVIFYMVGNMTQGLGLIWFYGTIVEDTLVAIEVAVLSYALLKWLGIHES